MFFKKFLNLIFIFKIILLKNTFAYSNYFDLRVNDTLIEKNQSDGTIYLCQGFKSPLDPELTHDLIAFESLIANELMVHHMILFACDDNVNVEFEPHLCKTSKAFTKCLQWVVQWSIGMPLMNKLYEQSGFRVGKNFNKIFYLQIHLNTMAESLPDQNVENSGFRIHFTDKLRPYIASSVQIGQESIEIPPNSDNALVQGGCSSTCTEFLFENSNITHIYLNRIYIHMHKLGVKGELYLVNKSEKLEKILISEENYDYIRPKVHLFDSSNKISIKKGDALLLKCYFSSNSGDRLRNQTIKWGDGAMAEMCYAFITYYPKVENFNKCTRKQESDVCGY